MPTAATFTQVTFRLRNDNGSESGATWIAVEGGDATLNVDTNYRCRFLIQESTPKSSTPDFKLMYSLNNGTYAYAASGQPVKPVTSTYFTDGDDCTNQLTGGSGTFHSDNNGMDSNGIVDAGTFPGGYYLELEYCFQIDSNYVANNDNIKLRAYASESIQHYYSDIPSITVSEGGDDPSSIINHVMHYRRLMSR